MKTLATRLKIDSWDEKPVTEFDDGSKITRAAVRLAEGEDGLHAGEFESVMFYRPDGTSHFVSVMRLTATLDGLTGTFVLSGFGSYDGTTASSATALIPGSATGELAGLSATCTSDSTHADYPYMPLVLAYEGA
jgi:hypothetical protein